MTTSKERAELVVAGMRAAAEDAEGNVYTRGPAGAALAARIQKAIDEAVAETLQAKPQRRHRVVIDVHGDDIPALQDAVAEYAKSVAEGRFGQSCFGGSSSGGWLFYTEIPEQTHEKYIEEINAWNAARDAEKAAAAANAIGELHCYTDDTDTVVATSPEDALEVWVAHTGGKLDAECTFELVPDDRLLRINNAFDDGKAVEKTALEWAKSNGRGFLCSTEY